MADRTYQQRDGHGSFNVVFRPGYSGVVIDVPNPEVIVPPPAYWQGRDMPYRGEQAHMLYSTLFQETMLGYPVTHQVERTDSGLEVLTFCCDTAGPVAEFRSDYGADTLHIQYHANFPDEDGTPFEGKFMDRLAAMAWIRTPPSVMVGNRMIQSIRSGYLVENEPAVLVVNGYAWAYDWKHDNGLDVKLPF